MLPRILCRYIARVKSTFGYMLGRPNIIRIRALGRVARTTNP